MGAPAFNWSEFLRLANELSARADEASHRSSISRAYYCVYHTASDRAIFNGYVDKKSHRQLWDLYARNLDRDCRKLASIGLRMKKERVAADYDAAVGRITDRMAGQLNRANTFLAQLSALNVALPLP
jgi:uncharacterized protein (UPF0332 family)